MTTRYLKTVVSRDEDHGDLVNTPLCFDYQTQKTLTVYPSGDSCHFGIPECANEKDASAQVDKYLENKHGLPSDISSRIEGICSYLVYRDWLSSITLLEQLRDWAIDGTIDKDPLVDWIMNGSTLKLFDIVFSRKDECKQLLKDVEGPMPYDNAVLGLDTAQFFMQRDPFVE